MKCNIFYFKIHFLLINELLVMFNSDVGYS